jgi:hypothetical protein
MNYSKAKYIEANRVIEGDLILDESRLYIANSNVSSSTYIPLDKIVNLKKNFKSVEIKAKLSAINSIKAKIILPRAAANSLVKELVARLNLKKKFLRRQWVGEAGWR